MMKTLTSDPMADELVEAVARALFEAGDKYSGLRWDSLANSEARKDAYRQEARAIIPLVREAERADQEWCWIVWAMKPGEANPRVLAICTTEELAKSYETACASPDHRTAVEKAPLDHVFGAADTRSVAFRASLRKARQRGEHTQESQP